MSETEDVSTSGPTSAVNLKLQQRERLRLLILERIACGGTLQEILDMLVLAVEDELQDVICSVLLLDPTGKFFQGGSAPSLPDGYNNAFQGVAIGPGVCSCGAAAFEKERIIVEDIQTHPFWEGARELAADVGVVACWSEPVFASSGRVIGTFAMYHMEPRVPDSAETELITQMAHLAGIAIEREQKDLALQQTSLRLRESDIRFRTLFEQAYDAIFLMDSEKFIDCNEKTLEIFACERTDIIGNHPVRFSPQFQPDGQPSSTMAQRRISTAMNGTPQRFEWRHQRLDGTAFDAEVSLNRIEIDDRPMLQAIVRDITQRKIAERSIAEQHRQLQDLVARRTADLDEHRSRLETILDHLPAIFFMKDTDGRYQRVNRQYALEVGLQEAEVTGKTDMEIFPVDTAESIQVVDRKVMESGQPYTFDEQVDHADGTPHDYLTTKVPLIDSDGKPYALIGIATDVTRLKQLQRELALSRDEAEHLSKVKGEFLANMSHEIRTPLNAVMGLARIGQRDSNDTQTRNLFGSILKSSSHLLSIINSVLDFSKLEAGMLSITSMPFNLDEMIIDIKSLVSAQASSKNIEFSCNLADDQPRWYTGDRIRISQILLNLLANAVKFTERGKVTLTIQSEDELTVFRVIDTGHGIPADMQDQLFMPFRQGDNSTTRKFGGTGLGLAISQGLADRMGGRIALEHSDSSGSTFALKLPLVVTDSPGIPKNSNLAPDTIRDLHGIRILIVEDNQLNRMVMEDMLTHAGASVMFAEHGRRAVELLSEQGAGSCDVVLMDIQMPVMDGYEATSRIRQLAPDLPVIGVTAHALEDERQRCLEAGMVDHITKPVSIIDLASVISRHVDTGKIRSDDKHGIPGDPHRGVLPTTHDIIEMDRLNTRFRGEPGMIQRLVRVAITSESDTPGKIETAIREHAFDDLLTIAHGLKSLSGYLESAALNQVAAMTEQAAKKRQPETFELATRLGQYLGIFLTRLQELHDAPAGGETKTGSSSTRHRRAASGKQ